VNGAEGFAWSRPCLFPQCNNAMQLGVCIGNTLGAGLSSGASCGCSRAPNITFSPRCPSPAQAALLVLDTPCCPSATRQCIGQPASAIPFAPAFPSGQLMGARTHRASRSPPVLLARPAELPGRGLPEQIRHSVTASRKGSAQPPRPHIGPSGHLAIQGSDGRPLQTLSPTQGLPHATQFQEAKGRH
jgi:hypothetical protein